MSREKSDEAMRAAILALKASTTWSSSEISAVLGLSVRQVNRIYSRSLKNGFDPSVRPLQINNSFVSDQPRSGRPKKRAEDSQRGKVMSSCIIYDGVEGVEYTGLRKSRPIKKRGPRTKMKGSSAESVPNPYALALERPEEEK
ncbi:hypothetical protein V8C34DRAFT_318361 [Trichoderma compactum]